MTKYVSNIEEIVFQVLHMGSVSAALLSDGFKHVYMFFYLNFHFIHMEYASVSCMNYIYIILMS